VWQCPKTNGGECPYLHERRDDAAPAAAPAGEDASMGAYDEAEHGY